MLHRFFDDRDISIHAPREGCDRCVEDLPGQAGISIHAPREGCDLQTLKTGAEIA